MMIGNIRRTISVARSWSCSSADGWSGRTVTIVVVAARPEFIFKGARISLEDTATGRLDFFHVRRSVVAGLAPALWSARG